MLGAINDRFNAKKNRIREDHFIGEAAMEVEEILPGSEDEMDDLVDSDSVPDNVYNKIDAALDKLIDDPEYDDTEVEELVDDDGTGDTGISDAEIDAVLDECAIAMGAVAA